MELLTYNAFYRIAKRLNEMNGNTYTEEEIAENTYDYITSYRFDWSHGYANYTMKNLCKEIDYNIKEEDLTIEEVEEILENFLEKEC